MYCKLSSVSLSISVCIVLSSLCAAQQLDAAAQSLIAKSHAAFSGGKPVSSVTMDGTASWHYGSDQQTGTVQLTANADGSSRMELHLDKGARIDTQSAFKARPHCSWAGFDGIEHETAPHNCLLSTVWFLPQIATQIADGTKEFVWVANGNQIQQKRSPKLKSRKAVEGIEKLSTSNLEVDAQTGLPVTLSFAAHPDNDALAEIPIEIHYSDYRQVNGVTVPFKIQKYANHDLVLELTITSASINGGSGAIAATLQ